MNGLQSGDLATLRKEAADKIRARARELGRSWVTASANVAEGATNEPEAEADVCWYDDEEMDTFFDEGGDKATKHVL